MKDFEKALYHHLEHEHADILASIRDEEKIPDEEAFYQVIDKFKQIHLYER